MEGSRPWLKILSLLFILLCFMEGPGNALSLTKNDDESRKASRQNLSSGSMIYFQEDLNFDHLPPKPIQQESRLLTYLMQNYDREVRPVFNFSDTVQVKVGITLTQIFDMDEKNQVMTTNVWFDQEWNDALLRWNPKDFGGVEMIRIPCDKIWLPDIVLYNNADDFTTEYMRSLALVKFNGDVFWPPPTKFRSTCPVNVAFFPFDDQTCMLKLGSWLHDGYSVDVTNRTAEVDLSNYVPNGEWQILERPQIVRTERYYNCCVEPFPEITISLRIRRKTLYYMYNIVFPCMMMSTLTVLVFCLPPDSGEKIALGVTVLLAFSVFMLAIAEKMPETSESIPLIGIYLTSVMAITCVSVIMTVTVLNFFYRGPTLTHVPVWAQRHILGKKVTNRGKFSRNREECGASRRRRQSQAQGLMMPQDDMASNYAERVSLSLLRHLSSRQEGSRRSPHESGQSRRSPRVSIANGTAVQGAPFGPNNWPNTHFPDIDDGDGEYLASFGNGNVSRRTSKGSQQHGHVDIRVTPPSNSESAVPSPQIDRFSNGTQSFDPRLNNSSPSPNSIGGRLSSNRGRRLSSNPIINALDSDLDINKIIAMMAEKQREDDQINEILKDWKMLAQKIDYFLFWVFLIITFLTSFLFIFVLPYHNRGKLL